MTNFGKNIVLTNFRHLDVYKDSNKLKLKKNVREFNSTHFESKNISFDLVNTLKKSDFENNAIKVLRKKFPLIILFF